MRTLRAIASMLLVAAAVGAGAGRADAHICPLAPEVNVGQPATVPVAVTVEATPIPDVEIQVPPQLRLDRVDPVAGWTITQDGQDVRYHGPPIQPFTCKYFSIGITALRKGAFAIPVVQRNAEGTIVAQSVPDGTLSNANPYLVQRVYAGVKPPSPPKSGPSAATIAGAVLVGLGVVLIGVLAVRSWRDRKADEREDEVQERVKAFKRQARDRSKGAPE